MCNVKCVCVQCTDMYVYGPYRREVCQKKKPTHVAQTCSKHAQHMRKHMPETCPKHPWNMSSAIMFDLAMQYNTFFVSFPITQEEHTLKYLLELATRPAPPPNDGVDEAKLKDCLPAVIPAVMYAG